MKKIICYFFALLFLFASIGAGFAYYIMFYPNSKEKETVTLKISSGTSFANIVQALDSLHLVRNPRYFVLTAKAFKLIRSLKAGKYDLKRNLSNYHLLKILAEGQAAMELVTIPEGLPARKIAAILQKELELDSIKFMQLAEDNAFAKKLGIPITRLEGYLYPDSYRLSWGMTEEQIIRVLVTRFQNLFTDSLKKRAEELGFTQHQIVTLASIIEGEAILADERVIISALYHNRLKRGIPLQADPTIQYMIPNGPRRLLNRDLKIDSPYNTYLKPGLPPGPINNPGIQSIQAALFPAPVDFLYMVAKGDGSHVFSYSLQQHLHAKSNFDRIRREVARKKRSETQHNNDQN